MRAKQATALLCCFIEVRFYGFTNFVSEINDGSYPNFQLLAYVPLADSCLGGGGGGGGPSPTPPPPRPTPPPPTGGGGGGNNGGR